MRIDPLRFFLTVGPHSTYLLGVMLAVGVSGIALLASDPSKGAEAIGPLALVQMFAASSGFSVPARRGHFDLLLTGGSTRISIALTHLAVSVAPGVLMWMAVGTAEMMAAHTVAPISFASGTIVLFMLVSGPAWALTAGLPRLSGAIGWLLVMSLWRAAGFDDRSVLGTLVCPFALIGQRLTSAPTVAAIVAITMSLLLPAAVIAWIVRMDVPVESAQ